ncbi:hypothetical protein Htur_5128 (plasmid) [Haloterrigena turkmenica DSM 5511]|uniref:Uncharacterized protein n=1 Tax=Haloterrigena turkmenica (strain ATCC 51198 / DSM 5511 / JCM 9101 / NCIMB 13204 / VKM B-1734 / 4k) TaxID=543526 RepID=D2S312_HALTV|nr:hypothetical protein [Haloterrigena turkmenica]ADB63759.1 hypothetical protein Htur_5128 [Haloterrigena turkmenica DSM 5511]
MVPQPEDIPHVTNGRALTTDRDRRHLARAGDADDSDHYQAVSRVRRRIRENIDEDVELLQEYNPRLLEELQGIVCEPTEDDGPLDEAIEHMIDALESVNRVRSRQYEAGTQDDRDRSVDSDEDDDDDGGQSGTEDVRLETALDHIDAARRALVAETEESISEAERDPDQ